MVRLLDLAPGDFNAYTILLRGQASVTTKENLQPASLPREEGCGNAKMTATGDYIAQDGFLDSLSFQH
jgi:hypothetical protein